MQIQDELVIVLLDLFSVNPNTNYICVISNTTLMALFGL